MRRGFRRGFAARKPEPAPDRLVKAAIEGATRLGLSPETVKSLCRNGTFDGAKQVGSSGWFIPESSLIAFIYSKATFVSTLHQSPNSHPSMRIRKSASTGIQA